MTDATWKRELSSATAEACAVANASGAEIVAAQIQAIFRKRACGDA
jgi:hypothetical protein